MRNRQLTLLAMAAVCVCAPGQPRKQKVEPPEEVYYANAFADYYRVPRCLVHAIIIQESGWNCSLVSDKGAIGCMQLMPTTARRYGVRHLFSVSENIGGGVQYLADLIKEFKDLRLVAAAYYGGSHRLEYRGLNYSNANVTEYVRSVRRIYDDEVIRHQQQKDTAARGE